MVIGHTFWPSFSLKGALSQLIYRFVYCFIILKQKKENIAKMAKKKKRNTNQSDKITAKKVKIPQE